MNDQLMTSKDAAEIFVERLISGAHNPTLEAMTALLEFGPPGRKKPLDEMNLHLWYQSLESAKRHHILDLLHHSIALAIFNCLVILDNKQGGFPLEGKLSDFAVYLQSYTSNESMLQNQPDSSVRLNMSYDPNGDLHDIFQAILGEHKTKPNRNEND